MLINKKEFSLKPIEDWLNYYIKYHEYPSISIGVADLTNQYFISKGFYNKEKEILASKDSNYCIASLSKVYTVIEILKLVESGKINLNDKVYKIFPEFKKKTVTVKNLLIHTAGLPRDGQFNFWLDKNFPTEKELEDYLPYIEYKEIGKYKYSNLGYAILGLILNKFQVKIKQIDLDRIVSYGKKFIDYQEKYSFIDHKSFTPSFGLYKNIIELTEFGQKLLAKNSDLLSKKSLREMFKIQIHRKDKDLDNVCLPWNKWKGDKVYQFTGYDFGFASDLLIDFNLNIVIATLTNSAKESFAGYFSRNVRRYFKYFTENNLEINFNSKLSGYYRCKDYDAIVYDCGKKLILTKPFLDLPFHPDNMETFSKKSYLKYSTNKKDDEYKKEDLTFNIDRNKITGFRQGGWGFRKLSQEEVDKMLNG